MAVLQEARASGIDFLEVARYNDESGTAPIPTGYSEVVFGEVFAASGWPRDEVTIASKLWWEFWPQTPAQELEASLRAHRPRALRLRLLRSTAARSADGRGGRLRRPARRRRPGARVGHRQLAGRAHRRGRARGAGAGRRAAVRRAAALQPDRARLGREPGDDRGAAGVRREGGRLLRARGRDPERQVRRRAPAAGWRARSTTRAGRAPCGRRASSRRWPPRWARRRPRWRWPSCSPTRWSRRSSSAPPAPEQIRENVAAADVVGTLTESQLERLRAIGV